MRAVLGREAVLRLRVDDEGGALVDADSLPVLAVKDGDGNAVAGVSSVTHESQGLYRATVPQQSKFDELAATWTYTLASFGRTSSDRVTIVGDRLVPLWMLREDAELQGLTVEQLTRLVEVVESWFKRALHFPPSEEPIRTSFWFDGGRILRVPGAKFIKQVYAIREGLSDMPPEKLAQLIVTERHIEFQLPGTFDILTGTYGQTFTPGNHVVWITHGPPWNGPAPADLQRAAATFGRYVSRANNYPERVTQVANIDGAVFSFSTPDPDKPTGLPEVDRVVTDTRLDEVV